MKPELEFQITKDDVLSQGYVPLSKKALVAHISNVTVTGDYEYSGHRIYKSFMDTNGDIEAKNDWGSHVFGRWSVDEYGHMSVEWDGYWDEWTGMAFEIEECIKFYDTTTGKWRTTFRDIEAGQQNIEVKLT